MYDHNLGFGFLSSESVEIFDDISHSFSKKIAEGTIFEKKYGEDREKITDSERIKPKTQVQNEGAVALRFIPCEDRPRERLQREGAEALALWELLAIIIGSGVRGKSAIGLARELLMHFKDLHGLLDATIEELIEIKGMGKAKAIKLKAIFAIAKRTRQEYLIGKAEMKTPKQVYELAKEEIGHHKQEVLLVILRDIRARLIHCEKVSIGTLSEVMVHPREVFYPAVRHKAYSLIIAHNHPSGDPSPSQADIDLTRCLIRSSRVMGITLADHLIIGATSYVSLKERGLIDEAI